MPKSPTKRKSPPSPKERGTSDPRQVLLRAAESGLGLIICPDQIRYQRALEFLQKESPAFQEASLRRFSASSLDEKGLKKLEQELNSLSLFSKKEVFLIEHIDELKAASLDNLLSFLEKLTASQSVFFSATQLASNAKFRKFFEKKNALVVFEALSGDALLDWILRELKRAQIEVENSRVVELLALSNLEQLDSIIKNIEQLSLYLLPADSKTPQAALRVKDLELFSRVPTSASEYELLAKLISGKLAELEQDLLSLDNSGKSPFYILAILQRGITQLFAMRSLLDRQIPEAHIASQLNINPWILKNSFPLAKKTSLLQLRKCMHELLRLDFRLKDKNFGPTMSMSNFFGRVAASSVR
jgi:DNA polymerase III delta subunit